MPNTQIWLSSREGDSLLGRAVMIGDQMDDLGTAAGVRIEREGPVLTVTLASPENRNAQTPATWRRLAEVESYVDADTRVILLRAEGRSFSAGLDRRMLTPEGVPGEASILDLASKAPGEVEAFIEQAQQGFTWWASSDAITIAAVQGHAIGAGFQLALACDLVLVASDAQFAMRETSLGLVPDLAGTRPLVHRIGYKRALEACATGRFIDAEEAVRIGLALSAHPADELDEAARSLAASMCASPQGATRDLKRLLRHATHASAEEQLAMERRLQLNRIAELSRLIQGTGS